MPLLTRLSKLPKWLVGIIPGVLLLGGLLAPPPFGPALLALVTLFLGWLLVLSWPRLEGRSKGLRAGVVLLLATATVARVAGII